MTGQMAAPQAVWQRKTKPGATLRRHITRQYREHTLVAGCSRRIWLETTTQPAYDVPRQLQCQRRGCKEHWPRVQYNGARFSAQDMKAWWTDASCHAYAESVLRFDYGLADIDWLVNSLSEAMEDAALTAVEDWIRDHDQELKDYAHLPRWCPCGKWPDFGVDCWYHGLCLCVDGSGAMAYSSYTTGKWIADWDRFTNHEQPALDRHCPVHPDGPIPAEILTRWGTWQRHYFTPKLGGQRGLGVGGRP